MNDRPSALTAVDRFGLQTQILNNDELSTWFLDICHGRKPAQDIDDATLAVLEAGDIVRQIDGVGVVLAGEGRAFARDLGITPPATRFELQLDSIDSKKILHDKRDLPTLWKIYKNKPTESLRNQLMEAYIPIVRLNAERVHSKLPKEVDLDDLTSAGIFGLMDCIESFDPERGIKFSTYCAPKIRGYILDELRSMDWVPRLIRSSDSALPHTDSNAGRMSRKWYETDANKDVREIDFLKDARKVNPLTELQKNALKKLITNGLTRAERLILIFYYYEELTLKEIAVTLDLSESRVSQMHSSILARLKTQLSRDDE